MAMNFTLPISAYPYGTAQLEQHGMVKLGEKKNITPEVSRTILELSL
jgi:hypothetical protein